MMFNLQRSRLFLRSAFFMLFVLAPPLDIFRFDLTLGHFILFGHPWTLGLDPFLAGEAGVGAAIFNIFLRGFLPIAATVALVIWVSWKYGRLYCGWLCPHFSIVETINALMRRTIGKHSIWDRETLPERSPDGSVVKPDGHYWWLTLAVAVALAFVWAVALLTYLLPPAEIYRNLWHASLTRNQGIFLIAATVVFSLDFTLARHLFCRFGCAVGLFQSLAWMANKKAMVVGFDRARGRACSDCDNACDNACPMRLKPRTIKRHMFTCTQCAQCVEACEQVQADNPHGALLQWVDNACALDKSDRDFGRRPVVPERCFDSGGTLKTRPVRFVARAASRTEKTPG